MSCSNCFNGCTEIVSDRCVRYTGIDVPVLGIKNGDSLSYVEQSLIEFLTAAIDGSGIVIDVPQSMLCNLVKKYLPTCGDLTATVLFQTLIQSVCDLQNQVTVSAENIVIINNELTALEGPYNIDCLTGVTSTSGTHAIVQALITKLCTFIVNVGVTYVKIADIDTYIANYIATAPPSVSKPYTKMIPYVAVPYFGVITGNFDSTGAGINDWIKVFICNGANLTPDLRGRVAVGVNDGTGGGGALNPIVDPNNTAAGGLTPTYSQSTPAGSNFVALTNVNQLPPHDHPSSTATSVVTEVPHNHAATTIINTSGSSTGFRHDAAGTASVDSTQGAKTNLTVATTVNIASQGAGAAHSNVQPGIGCYYIMYIP